MFGLEDQKKKKKPEEFLFDLEKELKDPVLYKQIKAKVEKHYQKINESIRGGEEQEEYTRFALLLLGYASLLKVIARAVAKPK